MTWEQAVEYSHKTGTAFVAKLAMSAMVSTTVPYIRFRDAVDEIEFIAVSLN